MKMLWRSLVFLLTILFIYLLFPILIVPSSLPAIQPAAPADAAVFQLETPQEPSLKNTLRFLKIRHRQGMNIILKR